MGRPQTGKTIVDGRLGSVKVSASLKELVIDITASLSGCGVLERDCKNYGVGLKKSEVRENVKPKVYFPPMEGFAADNGANESACTQASEEGSKSCR